MAFCLSRAAVGKAGISVGAGVLDGSYSKSLSLRASAHTGVGSDPSAACGRYSEVSEWQRSKFRRLKCRCEILGTATGNPFSRSAVETKIDATAA